MRHDMKLAEAPFRKIQNGTKTIEMRLWDEKRRLIKAGDEILFLNTSNNETLLTGVTKLHIFSTFADMIQNLGHERLGYLEKPTESHGMYSIYKQEDEAKYGVVGIELALAPSILAS